jgi:tripartite-type tricarboxylate transporter receptor subunit TctC
MQAKLPLIGLAAAMLATMFATAAPAQYPAKPIRIVVTTAPGGAPDIAARLLADRLSGALGQSVVVENKTGANGNIAGDLVAKSAPDGYTLLLAPDSVVTVNPHVYGNMPFDPLKDLVPVASVFRNQFYLTIHPGVPAKNAAGTRRLRAQSRSAAALRVGRAGQSAPPRHRNAQAAGRHRSRARPVSRRRSGRTGDGCRRDSCCARRGRRRRIDPVG